MKLCIEIPYCLWPLYFPLTHRLYVLSSPEVAASVDITITWLTLGLVSMVAERKMGFLLYCLTHCEQEEQPSLLEKVQMPKQDIEPGIEDELGNRIKKLDLDRYGIKMRMDQVSDRLAWVPWSRIASTGSSMEKQLRYLHLWWSP